MAWTQSVVWSVESSAWFVFNTQSEAMDRSFSQSVKSNGFQFTHTHTHIHTHICRLLLCCVFAHIFAQLDGVVIAWLRRLFICRW